MNFLADECIDYNIIKHLRDSGYTVLSIQEIQRGIPDNEVLDLANSKNSILLTIDTDFGELVYRRQMISTGVILIRLIDSTSQEKAHIVAQVIEQHKAELTNSFTVITSKNIRIRPLKIQD